MREVDDDDQQNQNQGQMMQRNVVWMSSQLFVVEAEDEVSSPEGARIKEVYARTDRVVVRRREEVGNEKEEEDETQQLF